MRFKHGQRIKVIASQSPEEFESEVNAVLDRLDRESANYELTLPSDKLLAFIVADVKRNVYESIKEEFEEGGEVHYCIECPHFVRPTNGNRKYSKCKYDGRVCRANTHCCECFYEQLFDGNIEPIEIDERFLGK